MKCSFVYPCSAESSMGNFSYFEQISWSSRSFISSAAVLLRSVCCLLSFERLCCAYWTCKLVTEHLWCTQSRSISQSETAFGAYWRWGHLEHALEIHPRTTSIHRSPFAQGTRWNASQGNSVSFLSMQKKHWEHLVLIVNKGFIAIPGCLF